MPVVHRVEYRTGAQALGSPRTASALGAAASGCTLQGLWGGTGDGGGVRHGDLLYNLLRGRKDHMTRVKVLFTTLGASISAHQRFDYCGLLRCLHRP